jgi:DNA-binding XRE family transcriptional regulator
MTRFQQLAVATSKRWENLDYERVVGVRYESRELVVHFADGTEARLDVDLLKAYGVRDDEWAGAGADEYHVSVPTEAEGAEIPWDVLRYMTDPEFRDYWDEVMTQAGRSVGARFRELREERNLSITDLANRARIDAELLGQLEAGEADADPKLEEHVLAVMGCSIDDLRQIEQPGGLYANT